MGEYGYFLEKHNAPSLQGGRGGEGGLTGCKVTVNTQSPFPPGREGWRGGEGDWQGVILQ